MRQDATSALGPNDKLVREIESPISVSDDRELRSSRLSFAQKRIWYHEQLHPGSELYNTPLVIELQGPLDTQVLTSVLDRVVERHENLRCVFRTVEGEPHQIWTPPTHIGLPVDDLSDVPLARRREAALELASKLVQKPIDLNDGPLFHARLLRLDQDHFWLVVMCHHIVFDGLSANVLAKELTAGYAAELGISKRLPPLRIQYDAFSEWQNSDDHAAETESDLSWWTTKLEGAPNLLALPTDRPRPPVQSFLGSSVAFEIADDVRHSTSELSRKLRVTEFTTYAAAFKILLQRLTGQDDVVVSSGVATRRLEGTEDLIGCFINVILLRTKVSESTPCGDFIKEVGRTIKDALAHQELPFERLVAALSPSRDLSYNPLAQVMIVFHNDSLAIPSIPGITSKRIFPDRRIAQYDLLLHIIPDRHRYSARFEYNVELFDRRTIERIAEQFMTILARMGDDTDGTVGSIYALPNNQVDEILAFNGGPSPYPDTRCIHEFFQDRVSQQPGAPAIVAAGGVTTYRELNERANRLAHALAERGDGRGDVIAVILDRSPTFVAALLAISKIGAGYVPIDPNYPAERVSYIIKDSRAKTIVTEKRLFEFTSVDLIEGNIFYVDVEDMASCPTANPANAALATDMLYLIYTSGSTGAPKGVMLDHRGRVNNFNDFNTRFGIGPGDRLLAVSSPSFDMCAYDVFGTLMAGAAIVLPSSGALPAPDEWAELIRAHGVTVWHSAPALLSSLLDLFDRGMAHPGPSLRLALLGGDWIPLTMPDDLRRYAGPDVIVVSLGGATEVSMDSTIYIVGERDQNWSSIPYGVAMENQRAFVLDNRMQLAPIGVAGELYLGGVGLGWGYHDRPGLTATRFVPCPYPDSPGERCYRTGDVARWTNEGSLELLGRTDFQVKINGVRIELGEIDAALCRMETIKASVTSLHTSNRGSPSLVSYIVPEADGFDWALIQQRLYDLLPAYMVPRQHVLLDRLPLSPNGKVSRKNLPVPGEDNVIRTPIVRPRTVAEKTIHSLWSSVLGNDEFGIDHDFFDLGGTSLQAASIVNRLHLPLSLLDFMRHSTVRGQAGAASHGPRASETRIFKFPTTGKRRSTLLCVPYAGGSAISFRGLSKVLPDHVSTAVVCMPSVEQVQTGSTLTSIAEQALNELTRDELENVSVYGHCAGTALASELVRQLHERGHRIGGWFLAAALPLGVPSPFTKPRQTDEEIIDFVAALGGAEETDDTQDWTDMAREFRRDSGLVRRHYEWLQTRPPTPLDIPLDIIFAWDDPLTEGHEKHRALWDRLSTNVNVHEMSGGHYFVSTKAAETAEIIRCRMNEVSPSK